MSEIASFQDTILLYRAVAYRPVLPWYAFLAQKFDSFSKR